MKLLKLYLTSIFVIYNFPYNDFYRSITSFNILMNEHTPFQYWQIYFWWLKSSPFLAKKAFAQEQIIYNLVVHAWISEIKMWWSQAKFFPSTWRLVNDFYRSIIGSWNGNFQKKKSKRILRGYKKNVKNCKSAFKIMTRLSFFIIYSYAQKWYIA